MHHTDYNSNLRKAQHKTIKNRSPWARSSDSGEDHSKDLVRAAIAALLVLVALMQMDPANAEPGFSNAGYGTLALYTADQPVLATAISSELTMIVDDSQLNLIVEQTFNNQTQEIDNAEYQFALPPQASIQAWSIRSEKSGEPIDLAGEIVRTGHSLTIPIANIPSNQPIQVHLNIAYPNKFIEQALPAMLPFTDDVNAEDLNSAAAAVESIGPVAASHVIGILHPL